MTSMSPNSAVSPTTYTVVPSSRITNPAGTLAAAGFPVRNGSTSKLVSPLAIPNAACPY